MHNIRDNDIDCFSVSNKKGRHTSLNDVSIAKSPSKLNPSHVPPFSKSYPAITPGLSLH